VKTMIPVLAIAILLAGCSDYNIEPQVTNPNGTNPTEAVPNIEVTPDAIVINEVCDTKEATVTIKNTGTAPLTLAQVFIQGEDFSVFVDDVPSAIVVGGKHELTVSSSGGSAELIIGSDDPDSPMIIVPLEAILDEIAPEVEITAPVDGDIMEISDIVALTGLVSDNDTAPEKIVIEWSTPDGTVDTTPANTTGAVVGEWVDTRPEGYQLLTLSAADACGNTASAAVTVCQQAGYDVDSLDIETWNFEGDANWDAANGWVELTPALADQAGTAFQTSSTVMSDEIAIEFSFYVSGGSGADGISLTALDTDLMTSFVGQLGGGLGYFGLPGWSIEVDTWYNGEYNDPTKQDHVSLHLDGDVSTYVAWSALPEMEDNAWHTMSVAVTGKRMTIIIDGVTYIDQEIATLRTFPAYIGFTAATGGSTNYHLIDSLKVTEYVCDPD
jgi:hypothetical protein